MKQYVSKDFLLNCEEIRTRRVITNGNKSKSLPRTTLSMLTGVDVGTLRRMEYESDFNPGIFAIAKLADFYNVSIETLLVKKN